MEIAKRLNAIIAQLLPFLSQEVNSKFICNNISTGRIFLTSYLHLKLMLSKHFFQHQQQVVTAVERAKQVSMSELNAIIGVSLPLPIS